MNITGSYQNMFRIPELKRKLLFTAMILIVYRLGGHVTTPGVDIDAIAEQFRQLSEAGGLVNLYDMFAETPAIRSAGKVSDVIAAYIARHEVVPVPARGRQTDLGR